MITILTSCWAATKKLLNGVNLPVALSSGSKSIRGTTANNFPSSLSN